MLRLVFCAVLIPGLAAAHHARSAFDLAISISVEDTVVEVAWTNPHYYLGGRESRDDGDVTWTFDVTDLDMAALVLTFEWSTDSGTTWNPATGVRPSSQEMRRSAAALTPTMSTELSQTKVRPMATT